MEFIMVRMAQAFRVPAAFLLSAAAACSLDSDASPLVTRQDSSGIEIVETIDAPGLRMSTWLIDPEPDISIGLVDGDEPYLFSQIQGAIRLDDGRFVVADGQSAQLRFFSPTGEFLHARGGLGSGPEEFSRLTDLKRCGTRIYAYNLTPSRVTVWSDDGRLVRAFELVEPGTNRSPYGIGRIACSPDGEFVIAGWGDSMSERYRGQAVTFEDRAPFWVLDTVGKPVGQLGVFPTTQRVATGGGVTTPPLGRRTVYSFGHDGVYLGTAEHFEVRRFDRMGRLLQIMRVADVVLDAAPVLDAIIQADPTGRDARLVARMRELGLSVPTRVPAFTDVQVDALGFVWVKRFPLPSDTTSHWGVFTPDGVYQGQVSTPGGLEILEIGPSHVLGITKDDLDVERIQLHGLARR